MGVFENHYPLDLKNKHHYRLGFVVAVWIFLFLFFAEPFKIDRFTLAKKLWTLPLYGLIQSASYLAALPYQNKVVSRHKKWQLKHEFVYFGIVVLVAWLSNYVFYLFFVTSHENTYSFIDHARFHFLPGLGFILPVFVVARFALGFLYERNLFQRKDFYVLGESKKDAVKLTKTDLICVKSEDNYLDVFFTHEGELKRKMVRGKLNAIVQTYPELLKVHRSYLINPNSFKSSGTESGKLVLYLNNDIKVPVSRNAKKEIKAYLGIS